MAVPLLFSSGVRQIAAWASRRTASFGDSDIATIEGLLPALCAATAA